ncbi:MAG: MaoC/PaaZ C-terminal domain-containing protein [Pseudomonadota bacterium]|nr:MaoC/PaaZ C-terminal domain-containing protein [Pseudomonadota bacterium]
MSLHFPAAPSVSLWSSFIKRGAWKGELPRIEAVADTIPTDAAAYARVCGFSHADPLPLTWPGVATIGLQLAVMTSPAFPLPVAGIVHTRQQITRRRHVRAGEVLSARCVVDGHRVVRAGGEFDMVVEVSSGGAIVWEGITTILTRGIRGHGGEREPTEAAPLKVTRSTRWRLPADQGRRYAAVSGDYNPIHLSPWTSRPFGFPKPIAHGWWTLARALAELDTDVPEACTVDVRFVSPVSLPGTVTFEAGKREEGPREGAEGLAFEVSGKKLCLVGSVRGG